MFNLPFLCFCSPAYFKEYGSFLSIQKSWNVFTPKIFLKKFVFYLKLGLSLWNNRSQTKKNKVLTKKAKYSHKRSLS